MWKRYKNSSFGEIIKNMLKSIKTLVDWKIKVIWSYLKPFFINFHCSEVGVFGHTVEDVA